LALAAALAAGACGGRADPFGDAEASTPRLFLPRAVSTGTEREYGITFAEAGTVAYFTRRGRRGPGGIFVTRYHSGTWSEPEPAPFGIPGDEAPFVTVDGSTLLFSSVRHLPDGDESRNIWVARRTPDGWGRPEPLAGAVNRPDGEIDEYDVGDETDPLLLPDGTLLFSTRVDPDWGADLFAAERGVDGTYGRPRPLLLNSPGDETSPAVTPDGRHLVFRAARRVGGPGGDDLYVSKRTETGWSVPTPLPPPINTPGNEGHPGFSPNGRYFFFSSDRHGRAGYTAIWYVRTEALGLVP